MLLTQSALGEMVGTSRESVSKCLNSWKQSGYVEAQSRGRHGSYYTIRDLEALETLAGYSLL